VRGIESQQKGTLGVKSVQEYLQETA
jgi:hypothetical protein